MSVSRYAIRAGSSGARREHFQLFAIPVTLALLALLVSACSGGSGDSAGSASPSASQAAPTPEATPTPERFGAVRAILDTQCRLGLFGAEIELEYTARAEGNRTISRLRLMVNGTTSLDTGSISEVEVKGIRTLSVGAGSRNTIQVIADSEGVRPTTANSVVRCPEAPEGPRL